MMENKIGRQAIGIIGVVVIGLKTVVIRVISIEAATLCAYPEEPSRIFYNGADKIVGYTCRISI
jgi:hypothetical protein